MNFETKHLIRWGIPGWTFLGALTIYFYIKESVLNSAFSISKIPAFMFTAIFVGVGIIIGHLIHQISMLLGFVIWNKWSDYFEKEFQFDQIIMKDEKGKEVQRIYSYRLGNVHALRSLNISLIIALVTTVVLSITMYFSSKVLLLIVTLFLLVVITFINYLYFKKNLEYFIMKIESINNNNQP
ncbi:hypothetical protein [Bacillus amyloliquefaciens]|uniref:hypothetical protein n=1 Tax=Bacillus amyloliquefaciens TaxID=1390 RepID=UPI0035C0DB26